MSVPARAQYAQCLAWHDDSSYPVCRGFYQSEAIQPIPEGEVRVKAREASLVSAGRSKLSGEVEVQEGERIVEADTAYIYRDLNTNQVTRVELFGRVK